MAEFRIERADDQYTWRLVGDTGRKLADSGEGFLTLEAAQDSIEEARSAAAAATIVDTEREVQEKLDQAGEESFPASDPPSAWARSS